MVTISARRSCASERCSCHLFFQLAMPVHLSIPSLHDVIIHLCFESINPCRWYALQDMHGKGALSVVANALQCLFATCVFCMEPLYCVNMCFLFLFCVASSSCVYSGSHSRMSQVHLEFYRGRVSTISLRQISCCFVSFCSLQCSLVVSDFSTGAHVCVTVMKLCGHCRCRCCLACAHTG